MKYLVRFVRYCSTGTSTEFSTDTTLSRPNISTLNNKAGNYAAKSRGVQSPGHDKVEKIAYGLRSTFRVHFCLDLTNLGFEFYAL